MSWRYDELRQVGVDFEDAALVSSYDSRQGSDRAAEQQLLSRLRVAPGHVVLDLGCGTGSFAREAARAGARVRAIDVSRPMLEFVRQAALRDGIAGLECERAGFLTFEADPASVDCIVTRFALHHLPDFWKQVALIRMSRALKPAGVLYLRDVAFSFAPHDWETAIEGWVRRMPGVSGFSREDFETHVREEYSTFAWVLEGFMARAGFEILEKAYPSAEYAEYVCVRSRG